VAPLALRYPPFGADANPSAIAICAAQTGPIWCASFSHTFQRPLVPMSARDPNAP
jgi:hypothetical protein